jgi:mRNA interferase MazF
MPSYSKDSVVLVRYPFADLTASKVRPAIVVSAPHSSRDLIVVPLTSRTSGLLAGEFILSGWSAAGLNVPTAVKRGLYTLHESLIVKGVGVLTSPDSAKLLDSLRSWLGIR